MSISNQRSSSSASRPKATKRAKATPRTSQKAPKAPKTVRTKAPKATKRSGAQRGASLQKVPSTNANRAALRAQRSGSTRLSGADAAATTKKSFSIPSGAPKIAFIAAVAVASVALIALVVLLVLSRMPVFVIESIDTQASEHVSAETVARLAGIDEGTTLLNADFDQISTNIKRNPWVKDVTISREFPDKLSITIEERQVGAVVVIGAGASVWALGTDGIWIEPITLDTSGVDIASAALTRAQELGCLLITDVPASVDPAQGSASTDDTIQAVLTYQNELPDDIKNQARVYYASSEASISLVLDSGLEISLGSSDDVNSKSMALSEIMATYPNQLTYINVRVASKPTYRKVPDGTSLSSVGEVVATNAEEAAAATADTSDEDSEDNSDSSDDSSDEE